MFPEIQKCVQMVLKTISGLYIFEVKQWQLSVSWNLTSFPKNLSLCYINLLYYINLFATVCPTNGKNISHIVMLEVNLLYRLITSMFSQQYPQLQSNMLIRSAKKRQEEEARTKRTNRMLIGMVSSDWWIAWSRERSPHLWLVAGRHLRHLLVPHQPDQPGGGLHGPRWQRVQLYEWWTNNNKTHIHNTTM